MGWQFAEMRSDSEGLELWKKSLSLRSMPQRLSYEMMVLFRKVVNRLAPSITRHIPDIGEEVFGRQREDRLRCPALAGSVAQPSKAVDCSAEG